MSVLEHALGDIKETLKKVDLAVDEIRKTLTVIETQRSAEDKARERWWKIITGVSVGISVAALGTLAAWVIHLQTALAAVGK